ncbi:hypothetical protein Syun_009865 [Stephania yunnanensis]|uniref:Uncharacterized protein n=1 Tax=Stephania yunnanensis TaxID=152371 RepID=A0AAP0PSP6_9MAGN
MTYERRFYFNLPEVQKALHANKINLPYSWSMCSRFYIVLNYNLCNFYRSSAQQFVLFQGIFFHLHLYSSQNKKKSQ